MAKKETYEEKIVRWRKEYPNTLAGMMKFFMVYIVAYLATNPTFKPSSGKFKGKDVSLKCMHVLNSGFGLNFQRVFYSKAKEFDINEKVSKETIASMKEVVLKLIENEKVECISFFPKDKDTGIVSNEEVLKWKSVYPYGNLPKKGSSIDLDSRAKNAPSF